MAKGFKHGAGGVGLNFKVVCNPQPTNPKENTIWIDTDRINNYYFSATQPENMVDYDVWISTGTSSTVAFSATTKNPIMVYPRSAQQYVGGALTDVTAMIFQNGVWVDWAYYLYDKGNEFEAITGGWDVAEFMFDDGYLAKQPTTTKTSAGITITNSTTNNSSGSASHEKPLDLRERKTLYVNVTQASGLNREIIAVVPEGQKYVLDTGCPILRDLTAGLKTLDISGIDSTKKHFVALVTSRAANGSQTGSFAVDTMWVV